MTAAGRLLRRGLPAALLPLLALAGCSLAGRPGDPDPAGGTEADETGYLDGSLDGSGAPAGVEELVLGRALATDEVEADAAGPAGAAGSEAEAEAGDAGAAGVVGTPLPLDEEIRTQFGTLFLDPAAPVPPEVTEQVAEYVELFHAGRARENFERWLAREGRYRELILGELRAAGLPDELLYLAMLESGFNPTAVSRAKAVGLWQFMRATGRESGLRIDDWVDERRDPVAATRAAIGHLQVLHRELGDWALAAAAYNAGLGRVRRAQNGSRAGYFDLVARGKLPRETRSYVPLILAAGHVARHRDRYGFGHVMPEPPHAYDTVEVAGRTRLSAVASVTGVPVAELVALNTHLVRGAAPPGTRYTLRVPVGTAVGTLPERLAALPVEERILPEYREVFATVRSGDSWWRIARAHGRTVKSLRALNPRVGDIIHPGQRILVQRQLVTDAQLAAEPPSRSAPATKATKATAASSAPTAPSSGSTGASPGSSAPSSGAGPASAGDSTYRVRPGDTMSGIAARLDIRLAELARWNGMEEPRPLRAGELLRVAPPPPPPPVRHRVAAGETMSGLAQTYDLTLAELVELNGLEKARPLRIGEVLVVGVGSSGGGAAAEAKEAAKEAAKDEVAPTEGPGAEAVQHLVMRGETLTSIARHYGVRIPDLVSWNQLGRARPLREGEVLVVRQGTDAP